jgi:anti-anti-sigma regulatory factor
MLAYIDSLILGQLLFESHHLEAQEGNFRIAPNKRNIEETGCRKD